MCVGLPGKVIELLDDRGTPMGIVDFGGATRAVCLVCTPDVSVEDYVVVHAGFALSRLDEAAAANSLQLFEELGFLTDSTGADRDRSPSLDEAAP